MEERFILAHSLRPSHSITEGRHGSGRPAAHAVSTIWKQIANRKWDQAVKCQGCPKSPTSPTVAPTSYMSNLPKQYRELKTNGSNVSIWRTVHSNHNILHSRKRPACFGRSFGVVWERAGLISHDDGSFCSVVRGNTVKRIRSEQKIHHF